MHHVTCWLLYRKQGIIQVTVSIISQYTYDTGIVLIPLLFVLSKDRFGTGKLGQESNALRHVVLPW